MVDFGMRCIERRLGRLYISVSNELISDSKDKTLPLYRPMRGQSPAKNI
jgi:hypothetical protein